MVILDLIYQLTLADGFGVDKQTGELKYEGDGTFGGSATAFGMIMSAIDMDSTIEISIHTSKSSSFVETYSNGEKVVDIDPNVEYSNRSSKMYLVSNETTSENQLTFILCISKWSTNIWLFSIFLHRGSCK